MFLLVGPKHKVAFEAILALIVALMVLCYLILWGVLATDHSPPDASEPGSDSGIVQVMSTNEGVNPCPPEDIKVHFHSIDNELISLIDGAKKTIDAAFYDLSHAGVIEALRQSHAKGVAIRLIVDDKRRLRGRNGVLGELESAGVSVEDDGRSSLMHNKFVIVDDCKVWTGSANATKYGLSKHENNTINISSRVVSAFFSDEFSEMWEGAYGARSPQSDDANIALVGKTQVEVMFAPEDPIAQKISQLIREAEKSVAFMQFSFTLDVIGDDLLSAHERGVDIRGLVEKTGAGSRHSEYKKLRCASINIRKWEPDGRERSLLHHKVLIVDDKTVVTGSFNLSRNASKRNDENVVIIYNSKRIAHLYTDELNDLTNAVKPTRDIKLDCE